MFVKHLQEYLDQFTNGKKGNAISNATIYMHVGGHLEEIRRIEVQESNMSKLDTNGKPIFNEQGKVMKGPNYFKPDLSKFLK